MAAGGPKKMFASEVFVVSYYQKFFLDVKSS